MIIILNFTIIFISIYFITLIYYQVYLFLNSQQYHQFILFNSLFIYIFNQIYLLTLITIIFHPIFYPSIISLSQIISSIKT